MKLVNIFRYIKKNPNYNKSIIDFLKDKIEITYQEYNDFLNKHNKCGNNYDNNEEVQQEDIDKVIELLDIKIIDKPAIKDINFKNNWPVYYENGKRKLSLVYHPDRNLSNDKCALLKSQSIQRYYDHIKNKYLKYKTKDLKLKKKLKNNSI